MNITIESRINVDGTWWDLTTEHVVQPGASPAEKVGNIKAIIKGLTSVGLISRVAAPNSTAFQRGKGPAELRGEADASAEQKEIPLPQCDLHRELMSVSQVQKKKGYTEFYCRLKDGSGEYCKNRATVHNETGNPKFWRVK